MMSKQEFWIIIYCTLRVLDNNTHNFALGHMCTILFTCLLFVFFLISRATHWTPYLKATQLARGKENRLPRGTEKPPKVQPLRVRQVGDKQPCQTSNTLLTIYHLYTKIKFLKYFYSIKCNNLTWFTNSLFTI